MKTPKQNAMEMIQRLPDDVTLDDIMEEMLFLQVVEERLATTDQEEVLSHEEAKRRLSKWLTSSGR